MENFIENNFEVEENNQVSIEEVMFGNEDGFTDSLDEIEAEPEPEEKPKKAKRKKDQPEAFNAELDLMKKQIEELQNRFVKVQQENEELRKPKVKKLDYQQAEKIFTTKVRLLKNINTFEAVKKQLDEITEIEPDRTNPLDSERFKLVFFGGYNGTNELLKISNLFVITKFKQFILSEIENKINELHAEVTSFEI